MSSKQETSKVYLAADHAGFALKKALLYFLQERGYAVEDVGAYEINADDDYPDYITPCAEAVADAWTRGGSANGHVFGVVIGGSGQGEAMAANRVRGARAAVFYGGSHATGSIDINGASATDAFDVVRLARKHNNANVLSLGARFLSDEEASRAVELFLETPFSEEERHMRRLAKY